jgi:hypothetical protein
VYPDNSVSKAFPPELLNYNFQFSIVLRIFAKTNKKLEAMNTIITAEIDVATPTGRRIIKDLERHKRTVKLNYPVSENITVKTYTHEEVWTNVERILNEHYGTDFKLLLPPL